MLFNKNCFLGWLSSILILTTMWHEHMVNFGQIDWGIAPLLRTEVQLRKKARKIFWAMEVTYYDKWHVSTISWRSYFKTFTVEPTTKGLSLRWTCCKYSTQECLSLRPTKEWTRLVVTETLHPSFMIWRPGKYPATGNNGKCWTSPQCKKLIQ